MPMTDRKARDLLNKAGLRATAPRIAVLRTLGAVRIPLSHSEVVERLGDVGWDKATTFRNLVKLRDAGIAPVVSRIDGIDRYALSDPLGVTHQHPHFRCDDCGRIACLPVDIIAAPAPDEAWSRSIQNAQIHLQGECPDCLARGPNRPPRPDGRRSRR